MANPALIILRTARHRYVARYDDLADMKMVPDRGALHDPAQFAQPCVGVELGPLLDPADQSALRRRHALLVPLRRRLVALLADQVEGMLEGGGGQPLPALLRERLREPWAKGALLLGDELLVVLDLRALARSALLTLSDQADRKGNTSYVTGR